MSAFVRSPFTSPSTPAPAAPSPAGTADGRIFIFSDPFVQGGLVHGHAPQGTTSLTLDGEPVPLTVSIGVAVAGPGEWDMAAVRRHADAALYTARRAGRNRVMGGISKMPEAV